MDSSVFSFDGNFTNFVSTDCGVMCAAYLSVNEQIFCHWGVCRSKEGPEISQ